MRNSCAGVGFGDVGRVVPEARVPVVGLARAELWELGTSRLLPYWILKSMLTGLPSRITCKLRLLAVRSRP